MKSDIIYFPFISVPDSAWLTRMLLYWDRVRTITPYEYLHEPERLGDHTQSLVQEGLVDPIFPGQYVYDIQGFEEGFLSFLDSNAEELKGRRQRLTSGECSPIHLEKLGDLGAGLIDLKLARVEGNWSMVERETAEEFMAYLATSLGRLPVVDAIPVTDQEAGLERLTTPLKVQRRLDSLRTAILDDVFPAPTRPLSAKEIGDFKRKYGQLLGGFRLEFDNEIIRLADIDDPNLRQFACENLSDRIKDEVREIVVRMGESGFGGISYSKWLAVLGNVPVVGQVASVISSVSALFKKDNNKIPGAFAYAGYAKAELLGNNET